MKNYDLLPVKKDHCNYTYKAPSGMDNCSDLYVTKFEWGASSVWKLNSILERIKFLFTGEITLIVHGQGMSPVSLASGDWYKKATSGN